MDQVVDRILDGAGAEGRTALLEHEVYDILRAGGLDVPRWTFWAGAPGPDVPDGVRTFLADLPSEQAVLKIVSPQILHKSDVGGLGFCPRDPESVLARARVIWEETGRRMPEADRRGILVMEKIPAVSGLASELLLSIKQDPAFGTVLVLGLGGVLTEWYGKFSYGTSTAILQPGSVREGLEQILPLLPFVSLLFRPSRQYPVPPLDLERTAGKLEAIGRLATAYGRAADRSARYTIEELEMNPMLLTADGRWVAVDGVGRFSEAKAAPPRRPLSKIGNLLAPKSVAVIGASAKGMNPGRVILRNLKQADGVEYGQIYAVHPKEKSIDGIPCVPSLDALPGRVDLAIVAIPAEGARDSIRAICEKDLASSIILIPGGFAETGKKDLEKQIIASLEASRSHPGGGPVLAGGNCLGIVSKWQYNTFFLPQYKLPFHDAPGESLAAISQSGAYLVSFTSNLDGIIFPRASISFGNQMDLTVSDFLEYYLDVDSVKVLACYVEGFKPLDGERFVRLAREARARGKWVIAFKAGKTALGAKAAQSHTASLAGDYAVARFLMYEAGVIVAETLNMFEDYTKAITMLWEKMPGRERRGHNVGIISNAGFECSAVLDKLYNLNLAKLSGETLARLKACLPEIAHADNPIDATPMAATPQFIEAVEAMLADPGVDAMLVSPIPVTPTLDNLAPDLGHSENIYAPSSLPQQLLRVYRATNKPMVVSVDSGRLYDPMVILLQRGGIPCYRKIDRASRALSAVCTL